MTTTAPEERGDLAARLLPIAAGLACIVHGDGDQRDVNTLLTHLTPAERDALLVVLAGLIDPDQRLCDALSYLTWDEHGQHAEPPTSKRTIRDIAVIRETQAGVRELLRHEQKITARALFHDRGMRQEDIAHHLGIHERTAYRWIHEVETAA